MIQEPHTIEDFERHLQLARQAKILSIDTEGTLTHPFSETWGLSFYAGGVADYYPFYHHFGQNLPLFWLDRIREVIEAHPMLLFWNAKHDVKALRNLNIHVKGRPYYDGMLTNHHVDENYWSRELDAQAKRYLGRSKEKSDDMQAIIKAFGWEGIPAEIMRHYGATDAELAALIFFQNYPEWEAEGLSGEYWAIEKEFLELVLDMEDEGVLIDQDLCQRELDRGLSEMNWIASELGFNPGSPTQLGKYLIDELNLPVVKTSKKTDKASFDKEAMKEYDYMLAAMGSKDAQMILAYRGWQKTTSSNYRAYLELMSPDGRLRPNFKLHGTRTGRLSCEKPNLQQIPRSSANDWNGQLKKAFIQDPEFSSWEFDYSQLEFRVGASRAYANESKLIEIFNDPSRDIFSEMAVDLGMERHDTKTLVYTTQYGGGVNRLKTVFGISELDAMRIRNNFFRQYRGLRAMADRAQASAKGRGYVKYWTGRRRHFPNERDAHKAWNSIIQGGAFEVVKRNSLAVKRAGLINDECRLNLQVHDSLRFDILKGKEHIYIPEIKRVLETPPVDFGVTFKVEVNRWATKESWQPAAA